MKGETKLETMENGLTIEQRFLTKLKRLELDRAICIGCGTCSEVCPKEAITLTDASISEGRLIEKPEVEIDPEKCVLCGTCVVFCPSNALSATVDNEEYVSVVMYGLMPTPKKTIEVDSEKCDIVCELKCQESCPVDAIKVVTEKVGEEEKITEVQVDKKLCIYCKKCVVACPLNLILVENPFKGTIEINTLKCPEGCQVCVDICPSETIKLDDKGKPEVTEDFCIKCSACKKACPEDAIEVNRTSINATPIKSGIWFKTLEKLTSTEVYSRELGNRAEKRRIEVVKNRLI